MIVMDMDVFSRRKLLCGIHLDKKLIFIVDKKSDKIIRTYRKWKMNESYCLQKEIMIELVYLNRIDKQILEQ